MVLHISQSCHACRVVRCCITVMPRLPCGAVLHHSHALRDVPCGVVVHHGAVKWPSRYCPPLLLRDAGGPRPNTSLHKGVQGGHAPTLRYTRGVGVRGHTAVLQGELP